MRLQRLLACHYPVALPYQRHIVSVLEHFQDDGRLCIVMEYADGGDLAQRIEAQAASTAAHGPCRPNAYEMRPAAVECGVPVVWKTFVTSPGSSWVRIFTAAIVNKIIAATEAIQIQKL